MEMVDACGFAFNTNFPVVLRDALVLHGDISIHLVTHSAQGHIILSAWDLMGILTFREISFLLKPWGGLHSSLIFLQIL